MKRKPAKRTTAKKKPALRAKPLMELWKRSPDGAFGLLPGIGGPQGQPATIGGVPTPPDLDPVIGFHAGECLLAHRYYMEHEPWFYWFLRLGCDGREYDNGTVMDDTLPRYFFDSSSCKPPPPRIDENGNDLSEPDGWNGENLDLNDRQWFAVGVAMRDAMREGFYLALLRYADELKSHPEVAAILAANRANSKKGTAAIKRKSEPKKREARRLDRELRKNVKFHKKYLRVEEIAKQMKTSTRTVQTYLSD